jgi:hypothetical protein
MSASPGLASDTATLEEIHRAVVAVLTPVSSTSPPDLTDTALEGATNTGTARIMDRLPVDPEDGAPVPEQYAHRGAFLTFPTEDNAQDTRGRETEGTRITAVLHLLYRLTPANQTASTYDAWRWEEAIRRRLLTAPTLRGYRPRYVGTQRGMSRTGAEWLTAAVTLTFYRYTWGA